MHQYNNFISDTHLEVLIDKYHQCDQYESVAFSHCITIDFLIPVHISAGATVIFQDNFQKPQERDQRSTDPPKV